MIQVDHYKFFPERMIFIPDSCDEERLNRIFQFYRILDDEANNRKIVDLHNADNVPVRPELLTHIGFSLSKNCNLRCQYCSACSTEGYSGSVPVQDVLALVSDIMKKWSIARLLGREKSSRLEIYFTGGGEPTYDWDSFTNLVLAIEDKASNNQVPIQLGITTNGVLSEEKADFLAGHFHRIMVSYDGLPEIQNRNRRSPHVTDTSACVERFVKRLCDDHAPLTIRTTVWLEDFARMRDMSDFLFGCFGCNFTWSILPVSPMGRAMRMYSSINRMTNDNKHDFLSVYLDVVQYSSAKWPHSKIETQFFSASPSHIYCGSLAHTAQCAWLTSNGDIVTCIEADAFPTVIGHVNDGRVSYKATCIDPLLKKTQQMFDSCKECFAYPFCKGGCPAKAISRERAHMDEGTPWECEMTVKFWKRLLNEVLMGKEFFGWKTSASRYPDLNRIGVLECVPAEVKKEDLLK